MDLFLRSQQLNQIFSFEKKTTIEESHLDIIPFRFSQTTGAGEIEAFQKDLPVTGFCCDTDNRIQENKSFSYTVFSPSRKSRHEDVIILLHGLNERTWAKYLTWAEYLAKKTGKPVLLFPIAFHMNRTPSLWNNPRELLPWVSKRKEEVSDSTNSTFANVALSSRIFGHPLRFYASGRESLFNLYQLVSEIKNGEHPLFRECTSVNLFAYSIGALLAQVVLLANPEKLFSNSRLFMFCGGSIFSEMNGNARDIMDKAAYERLIHYYLNDFIERRDIPPSFRDDYWEQAFKAMIRQDYMARERESFFRQACNRIRAISLRQDIVMPTEGIRKALGKVSEKILEELDFPFLYSHQVPFPMQSRIEPDAVNFAFRSVFKKAATFLGD